jgi:hypothetical protein
LLKYGKTPDNILSNQPSASHAMFPAAIPPPGHSVTDDGLSVGENT